MEHIIAKVRDGRAERETGSKRLDVEMGMGDGVYHLEGVKVINTQLNVDSCGDHAREGGGSAGRI